MFEKSPDITIASQAVALFSFFLIFSLKSTVHLIDLLAEGFVTSLVFLASSRAAADVFHFLSTSLSTLIHFGHECAGIKLGVK